MYCGKCGEKICLGDKYCGRCGALVFVDDQDKDAYLTQLAVRLKNGEEEVFKEIYDLTKEKTMRLAYTFYRSFDGDMEDEIQEIYVKAYNGIKTFHPEKGPFGGWFYALAKNHFIDCYRRNTKILEKEIVQTDLSGEGEDPFVIKDKDLSGIPDEAFNDKVVRDLLFDCMRDLSEVQKACIIYRFYNQMSYKEISEVMGISEGSVKSGINAGKKKIEANVVCLEKQGTKLYTLSPVVFVIYLLRRDELICEAAAGVPPVVAKAVAAGRVAEAISGQKSASVAGKSIADGGTVKTAAVSGARMAGAKALSGKVAAVILAGAVMTGGGAYMAKGKHNAVKQSQKVLEVQKAHEDKRDAETEEKVQTVLLPIKKTHTITGRNGIRETFKTTFQVEGKSPADKKVNEKLRDFSKACTDLSYVFRTDTRMISILEAKGAPGQKWDKGIPGSDAKDRTYRSCNIDVQSGKELSLKDITKDKEALKNSILQNGGKDKWKLVEAGFETPSSETEGFSWCMDYLGVMFYWPHSVVDNLRLSTVNQDIIKPSYCTRPENYIVPLPDLNGGVDIDRPKDLIIDGGESPETLKISNHRIEVLDGERSGSKFCESYITYGEQNVKIKGDIFLDAYLMHLEGKNYLVSSWTQWSASPAYVSTMELASGEIRTLYSEKDDQKASERPWHNDKLWEYRFDVQDNTSEKRQMIETLDPTNFMGWKYKAANGKGVKVRCTLRADGAIVEK